jgi:hypothetical protein
VVTDASAVSTSGHFQADYSVNETPSKTKERGITFNGYKLKDHGSVTDKIDGVPSVSGIHFGSEFVSWRVK